MPAVPVAAGVAVALKETLPVTVVLFVEVQATVGLVFAWLSVIKRIESSVENARSKSERFNTKPSFRCLRTTEWVKATRESSNYREINVWGDRLKLLYMNFKVLYLGAKCNCNLR